VVSSEKTLPKLLAEQAVAKENEVALRQKHLGIWNEITWGDYYKTVELLAIALSEEYDFNRGDKLAIIGENRPQWLFSQLAAQALGGISVGIYQESLPEQLVYYLNDCEARIVIVEDQEQVDKLLEIEAQIPLVKHIISYNQQGMRNYKHPKLADFDEVVATGKSLSKEESNFLRKVVERTLGNDTAIIAYSASTTGNPKGVMLSHSNLLAAAAGLEAVDKVEKKDDYLSFLPLAWIHEQVMSITMPLMTGMVTNFPEKPHTVLADLREIGPQTLLAPPRVYQSILSNFTTRMQGASRFNRKIYQTFKKYGDKVAKAKLNHQPISSGDKFMYMLGDLLVFSAIRDHIGLARIKRAYVAGATLETEALTFFHSIGVNVKQTYGGTELAGIAFVHRDEDIRVESAGTSLPGTEVKIGEDGEIFIKNQAIFSGYSKVSEVAEDNDGWISLGDSGRMDDNGHLFISDRKEDIITAVNGERIYPSMIENRLKASPYIQEAVCFGNNKPYLTALLNIDMNMFGSWANKNRIVYTDYSDLSRNSEVRKLIEDEVSKLMSHLPEGSRVKKFVILPKQLNANDGEMTRTLKIRRKTLNETYNTLIEDLYSGTSEVELADALAAGERGKPVKELSLQVSQ